MVRKHILLTLFSVSPRPTTRLLIPDNSYATSLPGTAIRQTVSRISLEFYESLSLFQ